MADFIPSSSASYPAPLKEIHDPPAGLFREGGYAFDRPAVAIVGTRRATHYGLATAHRLGADFARMGFCVVSGLARGVDSAAHEGALSAGGSTVAVLGAGLNVIYPPENRDLFGRIALSGALVSEFPPGRQPTAYSFIQRNRIISGLSAAVVVVESDLKGGAMATARFAGEQGRILFAVPGRIDQRTSAGCHLLIRDGAVLMTAAEDLFEELSYLSGMRPSETPRRPPKPTPRLTPEEKALMDCFRGGEILSPDDLSTRTRQPIFQVTSSLMMLEINGMLARQSDGRFCSI
jgi:DNA processing protein